MATHVAPSQSQAAADEQFEDYAPQHWRFLLFTATPSWMISLVLHMVGLFSLALVSMPVNTNTQTELLVAPPAP